MRLYLSGPMSNIPDFNAPAFHDAAAALRVSGYDVVNPADGGADPAKKWADYLRDDLRLLLDCDGVALLPGWVNSRGARLEVHVATQLGMPTAAYATWLNNADRVDDLVRELTS